MGVYLFAKEAGSKPTVDDFEEIQQRCLHTRSLSPGKKWKYLTHLSDATSSSEHGDLEAALLVSSGQGSHLALRIHLKS
jgi:hypothetical protein